MSNNLMHSAKLNAVTSYLNFAIISLLVFFISPYLISYLGSYYYGVWKSIQKILTFATVADGKATQALKWVIANDEVNTNIARKQKAVGSSLKVWVYFLPILIIVIALLVWNLPNLINGLKPSLVSSVYQVGLILGVNMLINPLFAIPDAILIGANKGYKSTSIQVVGATISNILMVWFSYLGYGIQGLAFAILLVTFFNGVFIFYICKKNISWFGIKKPSKEELKEFFGFSFWVFIWSFVQKIILSTEIVILGFLFNPENVTNYVFTAFIVQLAVSVSLITGSAITPGLGKVIGAKNFILANSIAQSLRDIIIFLAAFFGGVMLLLNKNFVSLWIGESFFLGANTNFLITLIMVHLIMIRIEAQIQDLTLKIKKKVIHGAFFAVLTVFLAFVGYKIFNHPIEGVFVGVLLGRFLHLLAFKNLVNKMLQLKKDKKIFVLYVYLIILFFISKVMPYSDSWGLFILIALTTSLVLITICYFLFLSKESKLNLLKIIKKE